MPPNSHFLVTINLHQIFKIKKLNKQSVNCPVDVVKVHFRFTTWKRVIGLVVGFVFNSVAKWVVHVFYSYVANWWKRRYWRFTWTIFKDHQTNSPAATAMTFFMTSTMQLLIQSIINFFSQFHSLFSSQRNC